MKMSLEKKRRIVEACSTVGLILICAGLVAPFAGSENATVLSLYKWIYTVGALVYTVARMIDVNAPGDSLRLRRMRRMEMWAGFAFCIGAFFWFYNAYRFAGFTFSLAVMNNTVMFTLAGALIQIIASWMIASAMRKEAKKPGEEFDKKKK